MTNKLFILCRYQAETEEHKAATELLEIYKNAREKIKKGEPLERHVNDGRPSSSGCATPISNARYCCYICCLFSILSSYSLSFMASFPYPRSISPIPSSRASSNGNADEIDADIVEDILCGLLELTDSTGRLISPPFRVLQSKEVRNQALTLFFMH